MFIYQFGFMKIKVTFEVDLQQIEHQMKDYYLHTLIDEGSDFDHHCHIRNWRTGVYQSPVQDIIEWREISVLVQSKRNLAIQAQWDSQLHSIIEVDEGQDYMNNDDHKKYWELTQRLSIYPSLVYKKGIMLHCAAVLVDGKVHVFLGPSGAGKSTIAEKAISCGYTVITDDTAILRQDENTIFLYSAPYQSKSGLLGQSGEYEVGNFYILTKSGQESVLQLEKKKFLKCLQERIYESQFLTHLFPLNSTGIGVKISEKLMRVAFRISKQYRAYNYKFTLDSNLSELFNLINKERATK